MRAFPLVLCTFAINLLVQELRSKGVGVVINKLAGSNTGPIVLPARVSPFLLDRYFILHTNLRLS